MNAAEQMCLPDNDARDREMGAAKADGRSLGWKIVTVEKCAVGGDFRIRTG
jgi:hypothetical protein